jgi:hypothetical protein
MIFETDGPRVAGARRTATAVNESLQNDLGDADLDGLPIGRNASCSSHPTAWPVADDLRPVDTGDREH